MPDSYHKRRWKLEARKLYGSICARKSKHKVHGHKSCNFYAVESSIRQGDYNDIRPVGESGPSFKEARFVRAFETRAKDRQGVMFVTPHHGLLDHTEKREYKEDKFSKKRFCTSLKKSNTASGSGTRLYQRYGTSGYNPKRKAGVPVLGLGSLRHQPMGISSTGFRKPKRWEINNAHSYSPLYYNLLEWNQVHAFLHHWRFMTAVASDWKEWGKQLLSNNPILPAKPKLIASWCYNKNQSDKQFEEYRGPKGLPRIFTNSHRYAGTYESLSIEPRYKRTPRDWTNWLAFLDQVKNHNVELASLYDEKSDPYDNLKEQFSSPCYKSMITNPGAPGCRGSELYWVFVIERYAIYEKIDNTEGRRDPLAHTEHSEDALVYKHQYGPHYLTWKEQASSNYCGNSIIVPMALKGTTGHRWEVPLELVQQEDWCEANAKWIDTTAKHIYTGKDKTLSNKSSWWYRTMFADILNGKNGRVDHWLKCQPYWELFGDHLDLMRLKSEKVLWDKEKRSILLASRTKNPLANDSLWREKIELYSKGEIRFFAPQWKTKTHSPEKGNGLLFSPNLRQVLADNKIVKQQIHEQENNRLRVLREQDQQRARDRLANLKLASYFPCLYTPTQLPFTSKRFARGPPSPTI